MASYVPSKFSREELARIEAAKRPLRGGVTPMLPCSTWNNREHADG